MSWTRRGPALGLKKNNKPYYHGKRIVDQEAWKFIAEKSVDAGRGPSPSVGVCFVFKFATTNASIDAVVWASHYSEPLYVELIDHRGDRMFSEAA